jgi:hypothetical protein
MKIDKIKSAILLFSITLLISCGGNKNSTTTDLPSDSGDSSDSGTLVTEDAGPDEISEKYDLNAVMATDAKGNEITVYLGLNVNLGKATVTEGLTNGTPNDNYIPITNEFIKVDYGADVEGLQVIKIYTKETFNTVYVKNTITQTMDIVPYKELEDGSVEFKVEPINGQVEFALYFLK